MIVGIQSNALSKDHLLDDYYTCLHVAYNSMREAFQHRAQSEGLTQDDIAVRLSVDKGLISKRLNGTDNLTLRTLSNMGSAMNCRVVVTFKPYEYVGIENVFNVAANLNAHSAEYAIEEFERAETLEQRSKTITLESTAASAIQIIDVVRGADWLNAINSIATSRSTKDLVLESGVAAVQRGLPGLNDAVANAAIALSSASPTGTYNG
jgi:transcriptional regulator with XRE-family HTH domain